MGNFSETFVSWMLVGVLIIAMMGFIISVQTDNGLNETILNDSIVNSSFVNLTEVLDSTSGTANNSKTSFESDDPDRGFGSLIIFAILGVGKTITGVILSIYKILFVLPATKLGIPAVVFNSLSSIILFSLVLKVWRVYRAGD